MLMSNKSCKFRRGFIATIAVTVLAYSVLAIMVVALVAVNSYVDNVYHYESRIEARQYLRSCLTEAEQMLSRDYFLRGTNSLPGLNCTFLVDNVGTQIQPSLVSLAVSVKVGSVVVKVEETIESHNYYLKVVSRKVID